jgi:transposase
MERQVERCGGLDVHRDTVAACVRIGGGPGQRTQQHVQTFRTTAGDLVVLRDWLAAQAVTHVAMERTGVYWKPVYYALESDFTCLLVNAAPIKQLPGRKTDVKDCAWIAKVPMRQIGLAVTHLRPLRRAARCPGAGNGEGSGVLVMS